MTRVVEHNTSWVWNWMKVFSKWILQLVYPIRSKTMWAFWPGNWTQQHNSWSVIFRDLVCIHSILRPHALLSFSPPLQDITGYYHPLAHQQWRYIVTLTGIVGPAHGHVWLSWTCQTTIKSAPATGQHIPCPEHVEIEGLDSLEAVIQFSTDLWDKIIVVCVDV